MPSNVTEKLYTGTQTFEEFMMAFVSGIVPKETLHAIQAGNPPTQFAPSEYSAKALQEAKANLTTIQAWSISEAEHQEALAYTQTKQFNAEVMETTQPVHVRYLAMLKQLEAWQAPTSKHEALKRQAKIALEQDLELDCNPALTNPQRLTGTAYKAQRVAEAERLVATYQKDCDYEVDLLKANVAYVQQLLNSLR